MTPFDLSVLFFLQMAFVETMMSENNDVLIRSYFKGRYVRAPSDFKECNDYLVNMGVSEKLRLEVICAIAREIQVIPSKWICEDCGIKVGEKDF